MDYATMGSGILGFIGQERTNQRMSREARLNRDFQAHMSSTAYQRAMTDMRKAGLNPILAYQKGGASTPAGSMASGFKSSIEKGVQSALQMAQLKQAKEQANLLTNQSALTKETAKTQIGIQALNSAKTLSEIETARLKKIEAQEKEIRTGLAAQNLVMLADSGLSELQFKHTVINQAGSEVYNWLKNYSQKVGKSVQATYDSIVKEFARQRNFTIPFVVDNPHLFIDYLKEKAAGYSEEWKKIGNSWKKIFKYNKPDYRK